MRDGADLSFNLWQQGPHRSGGDSTCWFSEGALVLGMVSAFCIADKNLPSSTVFCCTKRVPAILLVQNRASHKVHRHPLFDAQLSCALMIHQAQLLFRHARTGLKADRGSPRRDPAKGCDGLSAKCVSKKVGVHREKGYSQHLSLPSFWLSGHNPMHRAWGD